MVILGGNPSIQMYILWVSFQAGENNSMMSEALEGYVLASAESVNEDTGQQAPMVFMSPGGYFHDGNDSGWGYQKHPSFPISASGRPRPCV